MAKNPPFLFTWRAAFTSEDGPESPTTRHTLHGLSMFMDEQGGSCFPSIRKLATITGLSRSTVIPHLEQAVEDGWIKRRSKKSGGQAWRRYEYMAKIPDSLVREMDHLNKEVVREMDQVGPEGGPADSEGGSADRPKVVRELDTSTSVITPVNTPGEIYAFYLSEIAPQRKSKQRALKNTKTHLRKHSPGDLKQAVKNYKSTLNGTGPQFRKDPANFFGINELFFIDFLPGNFEPPEPETAGGQYAKL